MNGFANSDVVTVQIHDGAHRSCRTGDGQLNGRGIRAVTTARRTLLFGEQRAKILLNFIDDHSAGHILDGIDVVIFGKGDGQQLLAFRGCLIRFHLLDRPRCVILLIFKE